MDVMRNRRRWLALPVVVMAGLLAACQPPPPPDGRDLGVTVSPLSDSITPGLSEDVSATVTNHGSVAVSGVRLTYVTTAGTLFDMDTQLFGDCTGHGTAIVSCVYFTTLQPGQSWTMSGTVHYPDSVGTAKVGVVAWSPGTEPASDPHPNTVIQEVSVDTTSVVDVGPVGWEYAPGGTARVGQTVFSYNTTFHYGGPVSGLTVSQTIPAGFTIGAAQLIWDEELDDFSVVRHTGTCSLSGRTVTCTADATVIYGTDPMMSVALTPLAPGTFTIGHAASSPHPEPVPDPHPSSTTYQLTVSP